MKVIVEIQSNKHRWNALVCHGELKISNYSITPTPEDAPHFQRAARNGNSVTLYKAQTGVPFCRCTLKAAPGLGPSDFLLGNYVPIIAVSVLVKPGGEFLKDNIYILLPKGTVIPPGTLIQISDGFLMFSTVYRTLTAINEGATVVEAKVEMEILQPITKFDIDDPNL